MTGEEHKRIRKHARRNQSEWGALLGVGRTAVSDWERGAHSVPPYAMLIARMVEADESILAKLEAWRRDDQAVD